MHDYADAGGGQLQLVASFAGNSTYQPANDTQVFTITPEETTMSSAVRP